MSMRDYTYRKAARWAGNWRRSGSAPTLEMAFVAGWQAALRDLRKGNVPASLSAVLNKETSVPELGDGNEVCSQGGAEATREARDLSL